MMLAAGVKLGPYEVVGALGAGGMGEVYRARDTRLGRDVALKVLPEAFASDAERMGRFEREAKVLASLNHPNIATIHGLEESNGLRALVMELVEGPTLADLIAKGPIPIDEALPIAKQIAEGLEYAHERGIVHRDLKPANVKITPDGVAKILDFGLAKALAGDGAATSDPSASPTLSHLATQSGIILGTAAYMSPEQAKGKAVDRRADIWAFGCVLFEMLAAKQTFSGETGSEILAAAIKEEPNWAALPSLTPPRIRELIRRCLQKDAKQRLQAIGDARIAIEERLSGTDADALWAGEAPHLRPAWRRALLWGIAALAIVMAAPFAVDYFTRAPKAAPAIVSEISPPASTRFFPAAGPPALSPDGTRLAFSAVGSDGKPRLWVRLLDGTTAQPLEGTEGAAYPFWSPDGRSLGFFANGKLNRIDASGGPVIALADTPNGHGGTWSADGTVLFSPNFPGALFRVPASGGTPQPVTKLKTSLEEVFHACPQFLPDGKHFLFYDHTSSSQNSGIYVGSLDGSASKLLLRSDSNAVYVAPGYLLFVLKGTLMAQRFDAGGLRLTGDAVPVAEDVNVSSVALFGAFSASENGILAYQTGTNGGAGELLWFDRSGKQIGETGTAQNFATPSISPDGRKLAVGIFDPGSSVANIWVFDLSQGTPSRLTFPPYDDVGPGWSPDGKAIAFMSTRNGRFNLYQKAADGTGSTSPLLVDNANETAPVFSSDGRYLIFGRLAPTPGSPSAGIWALPLFGSRKPFPVVQGSAFTNGAPALSPDGKWLAYTSAESGRAEVYVVPFLHGNGKWEISSGGGTWARWRGDGRELFYMSLDNKIMSAEISEQGSSLVVGKVAPLFQANPIDIPGWTYDVSADGKKFVVVTQAAPKTSEPLTLVVNWPALLKKQ